MYPTNDPVARGFATCFPCGELGTLDLLLNVALFIPFGALLGWQSSRHSIVLYAAVISAAVSLAIEITQLVAIVGRAPSLADVLANTAGGITGAAAVTLTPRIWRGTPAAWRFLTWSWVLVGAAVLLFGAWAVELHVPYETYYVQWMPRRPTYAPFTGRLLNFSLDGSALTPGGVLQPSDLPPTFFKGQSAFAAAVMPGERPPRTALIARLALSSREFFMLGRQRDALVVRYRTNARRVGLRSPMHALDKAFGGGAQDDVRVEVVRQRTVVQLHAITPASELRSVQRMSAARLWASLLPLDRGLGPLGILGDVVWLGCLFLPAAFGGARGHAGLAALLPAFGLALCYGAIAVAFQQALLWWPLYLGIAVGVTAGFWLGIAPRTVKTSH